MSSVVRPFQQAEIASVGGGIIPTFKSPFCRLKAPDEQSVRWTEGFWADRFRQCAEITVPYLIEYVRDSNRSFSLEGLKIAAGLITGSEGDETLADEHGAVKAQLRDGATVSKFKGVRWNDEFVYKLLEAIAHVYMQTHDEKLDAIMDEWIDIIAKAQCPDGYIATQVQLTGIGRFVTPPNHELYVMGHLITTACTHHRATGKKSLLEVAEKLADYLYVVFMPRDPKLGHFGFNPSYIMALVDLYRLTRRRKYLDLAMTFLDMRGSVPGGTDQCQDAVPVREETKIVGHGVFFGYLLAGGADLLMETEDPALEEALNRLWEDLTLRKSYITACATPIRRGVSMRNHPVHEAAGRDYELPNTSGYNETCANIAAAMWGYRMTALTGEAKYMDYAERAFYNSVLSGQGLEGHSWFYVNVLRWWGKEQEYLWQDMPARRDPGFATQICCPSNMVRTISSIHAYAYSVGDDCLHVNLYGGSEFDGHLPDGTPLKMRQTTDYPWDGKVTLEFLQAPAKALSVHLRIPEWAQEATLHVNGQPVQAVLKPNTYATVERQWSEGDRIELDLPMRIKLMEGHYKIEETRNQVAVTRGPLVYCLESIDLPRDAHVWEIFLPRKVEFTHKFEKDLLGGVVVLDGEARRISQEFNGAIYRQYEPTQGEPIKIRLVPYYAWCNRGESEMSVWLPLI